MLVLTHTHSAWNSLFTIGQETTDFGIGANWTEESKRERKILLHCFFFLCYPFHLSLTSYMYWNSVGDRNYSGSPQDTELQINSAHVLII